MRQIVLDTETTGLEPDQGHRVIEIGAVEVINRRLTGNHFHRYLNPQREIDDGAFEVHGISSAFLADKPLFEQVWREFISYVEGAELVIHNAPFDVSFLDYELGRVKEAKLDNKSIRLKEICKITDSLVVARSKHPGQKNNLDALCRRYEVDNSQRELHGALLDAEILADVYLLMTGGQTQLFGQVSDSNTQDAASREQLSQIDFSQFSLPLVKADEAEIAAHDEFLDTIAKQQEPIFRTASIL